ncbi:MFS transporter [Oceaniserpentilla sp. 4NH20-0058]|uniref:MFS transporter n=1 Tax=Oceaniserpentilla sp. 4NH20-0058 TaxID=3127660 RepID=UPI003102E2B9
MSPIETRTISTLALIYALRMFGLFMVLPVLALYASDYEGASATLVGVAIGAYGLTQACLQLPFGVWSDRIGRKPVILIGLALFSAGSAMCAMADDIWMLVLGRALQGAGAVASTLMALMTDLTREENRTKAMASIGASIGLSFTLAMVIGPILATWLGLSGLFMLTAILAILAMFLLVAAVPTPKQQIRSRDARAFVNQLGDVFKDKQILRLSYGIFALHAVLVACFVAVPVALVKAGLVQNAHWQVYLPVMLVSFVFMVPFIIIGEKRQKMKQVLLIAVLLLIVSLMLLTLELNSIAGISFALWVFFVAFNILEASLPSLVSKFAPAGFKGSAMGVYSTCQFLGAFAGGMLGGYLSEYFGLVGVFIGTLPLLLIWVVLVMTMAKPRHLSSYRVALTTQACANEQLEQDLLAISGVHEVVIMLKDQAAYLKVDNTTFNPTSLKQINI